MSTPKRVPSRSFFNFVLPWQVCVVAICLLGTSAAAKTSSDMESLPYSERVVPTSWPPELPYSMALAEEFGPMLAVKDWDTWVRREGQLKAIYRHKRKVAIDSHKLLQEQGLAPPAVGLGDLHRQALRAHLEQLVGVFGSTRNALKNVGEAIKGVTKMVNTKRSLRWHLRRGATHFNMYMSNRGLPHQSQLNAGLRIVRPRGRNKSTE